MTGIGLEGTVEGKQVRVVSPRYVRDKQLEIDEVTFEDLSEEGKSVVFVLKDTELIGMIALADLVREEAKKLYRN